MKRLKLLLAFTMAIMMVFSFSGLTAFASTDPPTVTITDSDSIPTGDDLDDFNTVVYRNSDGQVTNVIVRGAGGGTGAPAWGTGTAGSRAAYIGNMSFQFSNQNVLVPLPVVRRLLAATMESNVVIAYQECPHTGLAALRVGSTNIATRVGENQIFTVTGNFPLPNNELPEAGASRTAVATSGTTAAWVDHAGGRSVGVPIRPIIEAIGGFVLWTPTTTRLYIPRTGPDVTSPSNAGVTITQRAQGDDRFDTFSVTSGFVFLPGLTRGTIANPAVTGVNQASVQYTAFSWFCGETERRIRINITPGGAYEIDVDNGPATFRFYF